MRIVIENEVEGDVSSLFRVTLNGKAIADGLTAVQAHLLIGDIFETALNPAGEGKRTPGAPVASGLANCSFE